MRTQSIWQQSTIWWISDRIDWRTCADEWMNEWFTDNGNWSSSLFDVDVCAIVLTAKKTIVACSIISNVFVSSCCNWVSDLEDRQRRNKCRETFRQLSPLLSSPSMHRYASCPSYPSSPPPNGLIGSDPSLHLFPNPKLLHLFHPHFINNAYKKAPNSLTFNLFFICLLSAPQLFTSSSLVVCKCQLAMRRQQQPQPLIHRHFFKSFFFLLFLRLYFTNNKKKCTHIAYV